MDTGWRARRRARIERVAAGGPLLARTPTPAQQSRRRVTAAGCFLAVVLALAVAAELRDGDGDGADRAPQTALRPEGPPPGGIVSDDGTADQEFAGGLAGDGSPAGRRTRERPRRDRGRDGGDQGSSSGGAATSGRPGSGGGPGASLPTTHSRGVPAPPATDPPRSRRVTRRVAGERRQRRPARRRSPVPAPAPSPSPVPAAPPPAPAPVEESKGKHDGKGHHEQEGRGGGHEHQGHDDGDDGKHDGKHDDNDD